MISNEKMNPSLRFKEYHDCWVEKYLGELLTVGSGKDYKHLSDGDIPVYGSGGYMSSVDQFLHNGKSVCIGRKGTINSPQFLNGKFWTVDTLFYTHSFKNVIPEHVYSIFLKTNWKKYNEASGVPSLSKSTIESIKVYHSNDLKEQQKIADFLSSVDKKIRLLKNKQQLISQYKKEVMQQLFSQEIRFKNENDEDFPDWQEDRIDGFVERVSNAVDVEADATYREIGIRSHGKGVFHKKEIKGHELGNKRVFWVHPDAFVVNIVFAWEHAVAKTSDRETGFIASHRFPMFIPRKNRVNLRFFTIFFLSKRGKHLLGLASPGGAGRNKTLGQSNFAELKVKFPTLEEQMKIADFYEAIDKKIKLVEKQIEHTQTYKKGLLQQMFV
jgi:type I restriction enzyme S subunit